MIIRLFSFALLIFFCVIGLASIHIVDKEYMWNSTQMAVHNAVQNSSQSFKINENETDLSSSIKNIIFKLIDTTLYVFEKVTIIAGRLAIENHLINFRLLLWLTIFALLVPIITGLIKICLIIYVFIYDFVHERRYKKEIKRLEVKNGLA